MVYVTGDTHGTEGVLARFKKRRFPVQDEMTSKDVVIVLGDFGCIWSNNPNPDDFGRWDENGRYHLKMLCANDGESPNERNALDWLAEKNYTTVFIDGNHDNIPRIESYPVVEWNGGKAHFIRPNVFHLIRGEVYSIDGKKFFAFGGAPSHDIKDGIIDPKKFRSRRDFIEKIHGMSTAGKYMFRIRNVSWWDKELPDGTEMTNGLENLDRNNWKVDYVLTHSGSASTIAVLRSLGEIHSEDSNLLSGYLQKIQNSLDYKKWFCGHYHVNRKITEKDTVLYEDIIRIC